MKYVLTIIGLICLLACSSEETTRTASQMRPIAFGDAYTAEPTRSNTAYSTEQGLSEGQSIGVYAYLHDNSTWSNEAVPNFMWNQQATCQEKGSNFNYSPLKYWPNETSDKVSFIAYFPYTAESPGNPESPAYPDNATGLQTLLTNEGTGLPTFNFTVKDDVDDQVDFLLSELLPNLPNHTSDVSPSEAEDRSELTVVDRVHFLFHHMTSKVEFRIVAAAEVRDAIAHFRLNSLNVSNLYKDGKLTPTYSDGTTTYTWTEQSAKHGTAPAYTFPLKTLTGYLLMPQTLSNDVMLSINYDVTFKSDGTTYHYVGTTPVADQDYTYHNEATIQLNTMKLTSTDTPLTEWLPNHHYIYTIRLRANRIEFTGEVVEWGDYGNTEEIKIEEK